MEGFFHLGKYFWHWKNLCNDKSILLTFWCFLTIWLFEKTLSNFVNTVLYNQLLSSHARTRTWKRAKSVRIQLIFNHMFVLKCKMFSLGRLVFKISRCKTKPNIYKTKAFKASLSTKKYCKAEYVQRHVPSSNVQVLFVFEVVLIVVFHRRSSSIKGCLSSKVVFH